MLVSWLLCYNYGVYLLLGRRDHKYVLFSRLDNNQDKTHFVISLGGENEFAHGWILGGDIQLQKGSHDRDVSASVMLRKVW